MEYDLQLQEDYEQVIIFRKFMQTQKNILTKIITKGNTC